MRDLFIVIRCATSPIMPRHWPYVSRVLSRGVGWEPPMLMVAALGVLLGINVGAGLILDIRFAKAFNLTTTASWFIVASAATTIVAARCVRNIWRYGLFGITRPNWWFECARLGVIVGLFSAISLPAMFFLPKPAMDLLVPVALVGSAVGGVGFLFTATVGYLSGFVNGFRANSKAFQCVHYFYCIAVPLIFMMAAAFQWPQPVFWPNGFLVICGFTASALLMFAGLWSIGSRNEQWEAAAKENQNRIERGPEPETPATA